MTDRRSISWGLPVAMFAVATFFYLYEFLLRVSPNVLEQDLFMAFKMDASQFGFFSSCYLWAYAPLQLPVGALTDKYGPRRLLTFAILLCAISTLALAYTQSFAVGCITRAFIGAGSAFAFISCIKIVNIWFEPRWFPFMTGLTLTIGTLGAAVGGTPLSYALDYLSWRELMIYIAGVGIVLAVFSWALIRDHNPLHPEYEEQTKNAPGFWKCVHEVARLPQSWIVGIYAFFITAPTDAFGGAWGVKYLVDVHGISRHSASVAAVTMTFVGMAIGSPLLGWIAEKINNRKWPMAISSMIACIALTLIVYLPTLTDLSAAILFFIFGAAGTYVLAFVMTKQFAESRYVATAVGFVNMISIFGSASLTYLIGWMLDYVYSGATSAQGEPIYTVADYHISLVMLPLFYAISAFMIVPFIRDKK
jgi:MFS family permease